MKSHELNIKGIKDRKRIGRGIGSGYGKTAGRGTKGQNSRSGGGVRPGFEGGQNPLAKRLPKKRGFAPLNQTTYQIVSLTQLESLKAGSTVTSETLLASGFIKSGNKPVKVLANGELTKKLTINLHAVTAAAQAAILQAGGSFERAETAKSPKQATKPQQA